MTQDSLAGTEKRGEPAYEGEIGAMTAISEILAKLDSSAQGRVLAWISSRLGVSPPAGHVGDRAPARDSAFAGVEREVSIPKSDHTGFQYPAELFDAARPKTDMEKALVLAYWFQVCQAQPSFASRQVNDELKHIGYGVGNITRALDSLCSAKPALVIQLEKSGKTKQAQKKFKVTHEGVKRVQQLIATIGEDK